MCCLLAGPPPDWQGPFVLLVADNVAVFNEGCGAFGMRSGWLSVVEVDEGQSRDWDMSRSRQPRRTVGPSYAGKAKVLLTSAGRGAAVFRACNPECTASWRFGGR